MSSRASLHCFTSNNLVKRALNQHFLGVSADIRSKLSPFMLKVMLNNPPIQLNSDIKKSPQLPKIIYEEDQWRDKLVKEIQKDQKYRIILKEPISFSSDFQRENDWIERALDKMFEIIRSGKMDKYDAFKEARKWLFDELDSNLGAWVTELNKKEVENLLVKNSKKLNQNKLLDQYDYFKEVAE